MKKILSQLAFVMALSFSSQAFASDKCGKVVIADFDWASATVLAHIDKYILENGYGCEVEIIAGATIPTSTSMVENQTPDIAPELWLNNFKDYVLKGEADKKLRIAGDAFVDGGQEGFWVPKYMVDQEPSLSTISGIIKNASLFEDSGMTSFVTCPDGWGCQIINGNLLKALNLDKAGFKPFVPENGIALDKSISVAFKNSKPWFGYYWSPTGILGKFEMVKVDFESGTDEEYFSTCLSQIDCKDPTPSMYPIAPVKTITTENFASKNPAAFEYISKRGLTNQEMNKFLAWMEDENVFGEEAAKHFLKTYMSIWSKWLPTDVILDLQKTIK